MKCASAFYRDTRAASAAEFALVLPLMLLFLFGIIDAGRYAWAINKTEKAVQIGTRYAVVTNPVPSGLLSYSYAVDGGITQGSALTAANFPGISCTSTTCAWIGGSGPAGFDVTFQAAPFTAMVDRMQQIDPGIADANVSINYLFSGIGFAGDPNGPDVAPIVQVTVASRPFTPLTTFLFTTINLPSISYSLTMEDGSGSVSN